ncbi:MAG: DUF2891 domain-containing protein [Nitriliruptoraceae bacterium]
MTPDEDRRPTPALDQDIASGFVRTGLANVAREYPNHPGHLLRGPADLVAPSQLHPVFYGSYDWHSCVHQHWMLLVLARWFPQLPERDQVIAWFDDNLTASGLAVERDYLVDRPWFERPYGWAWLLELDAEVVRWSRDGLARSAGDWATALAPLRTHVRDLALRWLTGTPLPQRGGVHANSAFAATRIRHAATITGDAQLVSAVDAAARRWYLDDHDAPTRFEPSATDFLSPTLTEAELLLEVLPAEDGIAWVSRLLTDPEPIAAPVEVPDRTDPQYVHLDGLNLSRALGWRRVAAALPDDHALATIAHDAARRHEAAGRAGLANDAYVATHWLTTFATLLAIT